MALVELAPARPYDLLASARGADGITRRVRGDAVELALRDGTARVRQRADGTLAIALEAPDPGAAERAVRFLLACDEPVDGLLALARADALLGAAVRRTPGLRALRTETVAHAVLRAFAGQLITYREAQAIERRVLRLATRAPADGLAPSPTADELLALGAARITACGLAPKRAEALMRLLRTVDLERLRDRAPERVAARLRRESQVGPWTVGVIGLHGYGWSDHGLVGDLNLMRLVGALAGRESTVEDTERLLAPYAPWRGLASLHLMGHPLARVRRGRAAAAEVPPRRFERLTPAFGGLCSIH